ncbi:MAG: zinc ribbon domain-containing protein [Planctomycetes bacterium]|nr:zinc ribbon domain-containing protein [Planctomycetota bacterium]
MPIYEYRCAKCDHQFEQLVRSFDGDADAACPECGSRKVEKLLSVFAARDGQSRPAPAAVGPCQQCGEAGPCPFGP